MIENREQVTMQIAEFIYLHLKEELSKENRDAFRDLMNGKGTTAFMRVTMKREVDGVELKATVNVERLGLIDGEITFDDRGDQWVLNRDIHVRINWNNPQAMRSPAAAAHVEIVKKAIAFAEAFQERFGSTVITTKGKSKEEIDQDNYRNNKMREQREVMLFLRDLPEKKNLRVGGNASFKRPLVGGKSQFSLKEGTYTGSINMKFYSVRILTPTTGDITRIE